MKKIDIKEVEYIAFNLAKKFMDDNEPIPDFSSRFPNILESCLAVPFQTFERKSFYKGLTGTGAIIFYLMVKNHPFQNGNKRIAVTTLLIFLYLNKKWLRSTESELYNLAKWVAESPAEAKDEVVSYIDRFIRRRIVDYKKLRVLE